MRFFKMTSNIFDDLASKEPYVQVKSNDLEFSR